MNQQELIADLRNKLGPIKNYIALEKKLKEIREEGDKESSLSYLIGYQIAKLESTMDKELEQIKINMLEIESILNKIEQDGQDIK